MAVLLVVGFIDWIQMPGHGRDMALLFGRARHRRGCRGRRRMAGCSGAAPRLAERGGYVIGTIGAAAVAFGAASSLHGSGFLAVYLAGLMLGNVRFPPSGRSPSSPGAALVAQVTMFVGSACWSFPRSSATSRSRGRCWRWCSSDRPSDCDIRQHHPRRVHGTRTVRDRVGGAPRGGPRRTGTFPVIDGVPTASTSSTSSSSWFCFRPCCRARPSSRLLRPLA